MARNIDGAQVTKIVRAQLAQRFPGITFSVRLKRYSGGSSIRVEWSDGPAVKQVERVVGMYHGASFDSMADLKEYHDSTLNGEQVSYGNDYIFCNRRHSLALTRKVAAMVAAHYGLDIDVDERGYVRDERVMGGEWTSNLVNRACAKYDDRTGKFYEEVTTYQMQHQA